VLTKITLNDNVGKRNMDMQMVLCAHVLCTRACHFLQ